MNFQKPLHKILVKLYSKLELNPNNAAGLDCFPVKVIEASANIVDSHLAYIINKDCKINKHFEHAKTALVRSIYKKDDRDQIKNYRPTIE